MIAPVRLNHAVLFVADTDRATRFYTMPSSGSGHVVQRTVA